MTRTCRHCDAPFNAGAPSNRKVYCSPECHAAYKTWSYRTNWPRTSIAINTCQECDEPFTSRRTAVYCSERCRYRHTHRRDYQLAFGLCDCGNLFAYIHRTNHRQRCGDCIRANREANRRVGRLTHKMRKRVATVEQFDPHTILERDGWRCHLCGKAIRRNLRWPHPRSASIDHLIPLGRDGEHSRADVAAAHLGCNQEKSTAERNEQLRVVG